MISVLLVTEYLNQTTKEHLYLIYYSWIWFFPHAIVLVAGYIEVVNCIDFANTILKNENKIKGEQKVYYSPRKYKNKGSYDIMIYISEHVNLVQLMDSLGNMNHDISVVGYWIFESNYKRALVLNI